MKKFNLLIILLFGTLLHVNAADSYTDYELDKTYPMSKTGTLDMKTSDAEIKIKGTDRNDIHIKVYRSVRSKGISVSNDDDFHITVTTIDGNVIVREHNSSYRVGIVANLEEVYTIDIELPLNGSLKLKGDDDDYKIYSINGKINVDVDDGDLFFQNCKGNYFNFRVEDGDIDIEGAHGKLIAVLDDGDINARDCEFSEIELRCNDGDIKIETIMANNGDYQFRTDDGDVTLKVKKGGGEFEVKHDDGRVRASSAFNQKYESDYKHKFTLEGGNAFVYIHTNDGNVYLNKN